MVDIVSRRPRSPPSFRRRDAACNHAAASHDITGHHCAKDRTQPSRVGVTETSLDVTRTIDDVWRTTSLD
jgi:hypothetical protein